MKNDTGNKIRVMLVDDSAVIRGFITKILEAEPDIAVVASCQNGQVAVSSILNAAPDIITLDVEMPIMDGITAIPLLLEKDPKARIIMCSTLTTQNGATTLKAMALGAIDCVAKPTSTQEIYGQDEFKTTLLHKIRMLAGPAASQRQAAPASPASTSSPAAPAARDRTALHPHLPKIVKLRPANEGWSGKPGIVAIGSSTGGPNALFKVLKHCAGFDIPIVITQHMPPTFTRILAEHIQNQTGIPAVEASENMPLEPGKIYVARGGVHMIFTEARTIHLDNGPMENFCRPAVDPMLRSLIPLYKDRILSVILTGMGQDGMRGSEEIAKAGGQVWAQDEATSVVWGMPGATALAGICSAVMPLDEIGPAIRKAVLRL